MCRGLSAPKPRLKIPTPCRGSRERDKVRTRYQVGNVGHKGGTFMERDENAIQCEKAGVTLGGGSQGREDDGQSLGN